jgi:hypothetical protein
LRPWIGSPFASIGTSGEVGSIVGRSVPTSRSPASRLAQGWSRGMPVVAQWRANSSSRCGCPRSSTPSCWSDQHSIPRSGTTVARNPSSPSRTYAGRSPSSMCSTRWWNPIAMPIGASGEPARYTTAAP